MCLSTMRSPGARYGGSSITNGASLFLNSVVLNTIAITMEKRMPIRYIRKIIFPA